MFMNNNKELLENYIMFRDEIHNNPIKIKKQIGEVRDLYAKYKVPKNQLLQDYLIIKEKENDENFFGAINPWEYLHRGIYKTEVESGVSKLENVFIFGAMKLAKESPTDIINMLFYPNRNNYILECEWLLKEFCEKISDEEDVLIIFPSPFVVKTFEGKKRTGKTYYITEDDTVARLYSLEYPSAVFLSQESDLSFGFSSALLFSRDHKIEVLNKFVECLTRCNHVAMGEVPNAYLDNAKYFAKDILKGKIESIVQIDSTLISTSPKKKCVITLKEKVDSVRISKTIYDIKGKKILLSECKEICEEKIWLNSTSICKLWNSEIDENIEKRINSKSDTFCFSKDIEISYKIYKTRNNYYAGRAWYRSIIDYELGLRKNKTSPMTEKGLRGTSIEHVVSNIWKAAFSDAILPYIKNDLIGILEANKDITLKSVWLLCRDDLQLVSAYDDIMFVELFGNGRSELGDYIAYKYTSEEFLTLLSNRLDCSVEDIPLHYIKQFYRLFNVARDNRYISNNPLTDVLRLYVNRASKRQLQVTKVLSKKHFSVEEEEKIFEYLVEEISDGKGHTIRRCVKDSKYFIGLIRLFTGMSLREACALNWEDFKRIPETDEYHFSVTKFLGMNGVITSHISRDDMDKYRLIPVARPLSILLKERIGYLHSLGQKGIELSKKPIIMQDEVYGKSFNRIKLSTAQSLSREIVKKAQIPINEIILPDAEGELYVDINKYNGDIFQSNAKMRFNHDCMMKEGEFNYILGTNRQSTYFVNYCDFSNDMIQYMMVRYLNRWTAKYEIRLAMNSDIICNHKKYDFQGRKSELCNEVVLKVLNNGEFAGNIAIDIRNEHGYILGKKELKKENEKRLI